MHCILTQIETYQTNSNLFIIEEERSTDTENMWCRIHYDFKANASESRENLGRQIIYRQKIEE